MIDFVRIKETAVRVTSLTRRTVVGDDGEERREVTLVVIVHGEQAHDSFCTLLGSRKLTLEIPEESGPESFAVEVVSTDHLTFGQGKTTAYRHEVTLRERTTAETDETEPAALSAEDVSVAVRLEALIEALAAAGVVDRGTIDSITQRLLDEIEGERRDDSSLHSE
jgi:hypothetical protein